MTLPAYTGNTPSRLTSPETFSTDTDYYHAYLATFIPQFNIDIAAMNLNDTTDTSASSVLIGTGSKSFSVSAGKSFQLGMWLKIADTAAPATNGMVGQVTSYAGTALVVTVPSYGVQGSGTKTAWTISLTAEPSAAISGAMQPVTSAASLAAARTAFGSGTAGDAVFVAATKADVRAAAGVKQLQVLDATVAASALTITLQPTNIDFRSTTLGSGAITNVDVPSAITVVVPSGATLGSANAVASRIAVIALNNAGTVELAVINVGGGVVSNEDALLSTTVMNTSSDANNIAYSTTARTGVAFRVLGYVEYTQATAGTYATAPSLIAGAGSALQPVNATLGYNQAWADYTGSRVKGTTYTNTTGRPISVFVTCTGGAIGGQLYLYSNGVEVGRTNTAYVAAGVITGTFIVPPGHTYSIADASSTNSVFRWTELR